MLDRRLELTAGPGLGQRSNNTALLIHFSSLNFLYVNNRLSHRPSLMLIVWSRQKPTSSWTSSVSNFWTTSTGPGHHGSKAGLKQCQIECSIAKLSIICIDNELPQPFHLGLSHTPCTQIVNKTLPIKRICTKSMANVKLCFGVRSMSS